MRRFGTRNASDSRLGISLVLSFGLAFVPAIVHADSWASYPGAFCRDAGVANPGYSLGGTVGTIPGRVDGGSFRTANPANFIVQSDGTGISYTPHEERASSFDDDYGRMTVCPIVRRDAATFGTIAIWMDRPPEAYVSCSATVAGAALGGVWLGSSGFVRRTVTSFDGAPAFRVLDGGTAYQSVLLTIEDLPAVVRGMGDRVWISCRGPGAAEGSLRNLGNTRIVSYDVREVPGSGGSILRDSTGVTVGALPSVMAEIEGALVFATDSSQGLASALAPGIEEMGASLESIACGESACRLTIQGAESGVVLDLLEAIPEQRGADLVLHRSDPESGDPVVVEVLVALPGASLPWPTAD